MTTLLAFAMSVGISLAGLLYLIAIDPKRRRVFALYAPRRVPVSKRAGWVVVILPGIALAWSGQISAMLAWFGAVTVGAWLLASRHPR